MKICENGFVREMTAEEIIATQKAEQADNRTVGPLTDERKLERLLKSIPVQDMPSVEPKLGYRWQPMYNSTAGFAWELVEDPTALGTRQNPWYWVSGMVVKMGHHYTSNGTAVYIALEDGVPPAWSAPDWFAEVIDG